MITIHTCAQGSPEWHALRSDRYTGQHAHKLLSDPNAVSLLFGERRAYALNQTSSFTGNFYTERGHALENEAFEIYEAVTGHAISRPGFVTNTRYPNCGYSPDGHDDADQAIIENKSFGKDKHLALCAIRDPLSLPLPIVAQIYFGMTIWQKRRGRLMLYNPQLAKEGRPELAFKIINIPYRTDIIARFREVITHGQKTAAFGIK